MAQWEMWANRKKRGGNGGNMEMGAKKGKVSPCGQGFDELLDISHETGVYTFSTNL